MDEFPVLFPDSPGGLIGATKTSHLEYLTVVARVVSISVMNV